MKHLLLLLSSVLIFSCQSEAKQEEKQPIVEQNEQPKTNESNEKQDVKSCNNEKIAYDFLNEYISIVNEKSFDEIQDWIANNPIVSSEYVARYKEIFETNEYIEADPVLFSQDFPENFIIKESNGEYVSLTADGWGDYKWLVRVKDCKVIGSGLINIPRKIYDNGIEGLSFDQQIQEIRAVYANVNENLANYKVTELENEDSTEGGTEKIYIHNNQFVKIVQEYFGEMGKRAMEYYFTEEGALRFVFEKITNYNSPIYITEPTEDGMEAFDPEKSTVEENRYYFYNDKMIQWLLPTGEIADYDQWKLDEKQEELLKVYQKYQ